jgi:hypothetical protein
MARRKRPKGQRTIYKALHRHRATITPLNSGILFGLFYFIKQRLATILPAAITRSKHQVNLILKLVMTSTDACRNTYPLSEHADNSDGVKWVNVILISNR